MLKSLALKDVYNSDDDNILEDFYIPALQMAVSYDRSAGYFDAKILVTAIRGLSVFVENGGCIRLIVGATITHDDYDAISLGYTEREVEDRIAKNFEQSLDTSDNKYNKNQLNVLTWFIKNKKLDIKIALRRNGIFHEKIGVLKDKDNNVIVFQGSANETNNALSPINHESINVFKSWIPGFAGHIDPHVSKFEQLWNNKAKNTKVLNFTEITEIILSRNLGDTERPDINRELKLWQEEISINNKNNILNGPTIPEQIYGEKFELKKHQKNALEAWIKNNFKGLFELATGSGKTITAIYGAIKLFQSRNKLFFVIAVPYQSLADQWSDNLNVFNINPLICYGGEERWLNELNKKINDFKAGIVNFAAIVVVNATLCSDKKTFLNLINTLGEDNEEYFMFVGDECHHHGSIANFEALPKYAGLRIGLSATPERSDEEGNNNLENYYGNIVAEYSLKDALNDGVLTPYKYHLIPVSLTNEECEKYISLCKQISRLVAQTQNSNIKNNNAFNALCSKRARLITGAQNKPIALKNLLNNIQQPINHSLFYCAEGIVDVTDNDEQDDIKQIEIISRILSDKGWRSSQFTANENKEQRVLILNSFKNCHIHSLVAMKCLDEGIDVPACNTAFILASSTQPRQFIQRRGRILRKSKNKEFAVIYDFFVTLPINDVEDEGYEKKLMIKELKRINEFAKLSMNKGEVLNTLLPFLIKNDLVHYFNRYEENG
jgi:superfamily II DNA or RNA helicase